MKMCDGIVRIRRVTVPSDSGGMYFFSTHLIIDDGAFGSFDIKKNTEIFVQFF